MTKLAEEIQRLERFVAEGDAERALAGYERLLAENPRDPVLCTRVNFLRDSLHRHAPEWQVCTYVISPQAVAEAHIMNGSYREALEILEWLLESHPEDTGLARRVAMVRAMRDGGKELGIEPTASTHIMTAEMLVEAHTAAGEIEAALRLLKALIAQRRENAHLKERLAALEAAWGRSAADLPPARLELPEAEFSEESGAQTMPDDVPPAAAQAVEQGPVARAADAVFGEELPIHRTPPRGPVTQAAETEFGGPPLEAPGDDHSEVFSSRVEAAVAPPQAAPAPAPQEAGALAEAAPSTRVRPVTQNGPGMLESMLAEAQQTMRRERLQRRQPEPPGGPTQRPRSAPAAPAAPAEPAAPARPAAPAALAAPAEPDAHEHSLDGQTRPGKISARSKAVKTSAAEPGAASSPAPEEAEGTSGTKKKRRRKKADKGEVRGRRYVRKRRRQLQERSGHDLVAGDPHLSVAGKLLGSPPEEVTEAAALEPFDIHEQLTMPDGKVPLPPRGEEGVPMANPDDFDEISTIAEARQLPGRAASGRSRSVRAQAQPAPGVAPSAMDLFDDDDDPTMADDRPPAGMPPPRREVVPALEQIGPPAARPTRPQRPRKKK